MHHVRGHIIQYFPISSSKKPSFDCTGVSLWNSHEAEANIRPQIQPLDAPFSSDVCSVVETDRGQRFVGISPRMSSSPPSHRAHHYSVTSLLWVPSLHFMFDFHIPSANLKNISNKTCMPERTSCWCAIWWCNSCYPTYFPKPARRQSSHAGSSNNITELQIGDCMKFTSIYILLGTFGGEWLQLGIDRINIQHPWQLWGNRLASWGLPFNICDVWSGSYCPLFHPVLAVDAHTEKEGGESAFLLLAA